MVAGLLFEVKNTADVVTNQVYSPFAHCGNLFGDLEV
jgi:hypothetical protein